MPIQQEVPDKLVLSKLDAFLDEFIKTELRKPLPIKNFQLIQDVNNKIIYYETKNCLKSG
jgi:hypothetical protein